MYVNTCCGNKIIIIIIIKKKKKVLIFVKGENMKLKSVNCESLLVVMREL